MVESANIDTPSSAFSVIEFGFNALLWAHATVGRAGERKAHSSCPQLYCDAYWPDEVGMQFDPSPVGATKVYVKPA